MRGRQAKIFHPALVLSLACAFVSAAHGQPADGSFSSKALYKGEAAGIPIEPLDPNLLPVQPGPSKPKPSITRRESPTGTYINARGSGIGYLDTELVALRDGEALLVLKRFLFENQYVLYDPSTYELDIHRVDRNKDGLMLYFYQLVNGMKLFRPGRIRVNNSDEVSWMSMHFANPEEITFDASYFMAEERLRTFIKDIFISEIGEFDDSNVNHIDYVIFSMGNGAEHVPAAYVYYQMYILLVNAQTGEKLQFLSTLTGG